MAYSPLPAKAAGDVFDKTAYDIIKADLEASAPGVVAAKGDLVAATGANAIARLAAGADGSTIVYDSTTSVGLAAQTQPAARVWNDADIDPAPGGWVTLTFNNENAGNGCFDTDAMHSLVSNTGRLTVPAGGGGIYTLGGCVKLDTTGGPANDPVRLRIRVDGATEIARVQGHTGSDIELSVVTAYSLIAGQYAELQIFTEENVDVLTDNYHSPVFWAIYQRRA